jgi:hypothetical protein
MLTYTCFSMHTRESICRKELATWPSSLEQRDTRPHVCHKLNAQSDERGKNARSPGSPESSHPELAQTRAVDSLQTEMGHGVL